MGMDAIVRGVVSGTGAEVDANGNLKVTMPQVETQAGYVSIQAEVDDGEVTGARVLRQPNASIFNRLSVGIDTPQFSSYFNASAQNTSIWRSAVTTFTTAQANGYLILNNGAVTTTGAAAIYQTYRTFTMVGQGPMVFEFSEFRSIVMPTNSVAEVGLFAANLGSTPFTPGDGVYFRFNAASGLLGVLNYNGTEFSTTLLAPGAMVVNDNTTYRIVINHYRIEFWGASSTSDPRILLGIIPVPSSNGPPFQALSAPISIRMAFTGTAGAAVQLKIANAVVAQQDLNTGKAYPDQQAGMGLIAAQGQDGGTMGSTAGYANNLAAGAGATMTNTTAALGTGLGGQFSALPTLAVGTDGIVCSYQNPAGSVTQTPRTMYVTGIQIQGAVTTALTGGPVLYAYSVAFGSTALSLTTAEGIATKAPRRIALGYETYAATAAVGVTGAGVSMRFATPIAVNAGEFVVIAAKNQGVVTTVGVITFLVTFDAYME